MISDVKKWIFIHVPKCGGMSIRAALMAAPRHAARRMNADHPECCEFRPKPLKHCNHLTALEVIELVGQETWDEYFTFGFVRNPWARVVSEFHWRRQGRSWHGLKFWTDFTKFVYALRDGWDYVGDGERHVWPQARYLADADGNVLVKHVGRMEGFKNEFQELQDLIDSHVSPGKRNKSKHKNYLEYYTPELAKIVGEVYAEDVEIFGYKYKYL